MPLRLKQQYSNDVVLPLLVRKFEEYSAMKDQGKEVKYFETIPQDDGFKPIIQLYRNHRASNMYEGIGIDFEKFDFPNDKPEWENFMTYVDFESFLGYLRKGLQRLEDKLIPINIVAGKPDRDPSPEPVASEYQGWNNLDIDERKKGYSMIYE
jgi:hypothetical protein